MKKTVICILLILCVGLSVFCLSACNNVGDYLKPEFAVTNRNYTVEAVTNADGDFDFPIGGLKFEKDRYTQENCFQFSWVIYDADHNIFGWIETDGGHSTLKNGKFLYGFSASTSNGVYGYGKPLVTLILRGTDPDLFDSVSITADNADVNETQLEAASATQRYSEYDQESGSMIIAPNASQFVYKIYQVDLEGIKPSDIKSLRITIDLGEFAA